MDNANATKNSEIGPLEVHVLKRDRKQGSAPHSHQHGQFVFLKSGVLKLRTSAGTWVFPTGRLAWIPKEIFHSAEALSEVEGWTILVSESFENLMPREVCLIKASTLLMSLLDRIVYPHDDSVKARRYMLSLIKIELKDVEMESLNMNIPLPVTPALQSVAEEALKNLSAFRRLEEWASMAGKSKRSFTRHFYLETGMSFDEWRKTAIHLRASDLLSQGKQVSEVAFELGYESVSAFIAMFKKHFGESPLKYVKEQEHRRVEQAAEA